MPETDTISTGFASVSLARAAEVPVPQVNALASRLPLTANPSPLAKNERAAVLRSLHFGNAFTGHMARARWRQGEGWDDCDVISYGSLNLSLVAAVLHYNQEVFGDTKTYRYEDGSVWTFRLRYNAAHLDASARRTALPRLAEEDFATPLVGLVRANATWVPSGESKFLYLCPPVLASEAFLSMCPATVVDYYIIASPAGPYFPHNLEPVSIWMTTGCHRAGRGGTGVIRIGGNCIFSLFPQQEAYVKGCGQVYSLDDVSRKNIEELGDMSLMVVNADGTVRTPHLAGTILEGYTCSAIIRPLYDSGRNVVEETASLQGLLADIESDRVNEIFACGTATVVVPLGYLRGESFDTRIEGSEVTRQVHDRLTAVQAGRAEDPYG